jgi:two-component system LytT family response regulator
MKTRNMDPIIQGSVITTEKTETRHVKKKQSTDLNMLLSLLQSRSAKISVPIFDGLQMLNTEDIVKCVAHESYTEIVLTCGSKYLVSRILKEYEMMLSGLNFFRIHHSCLINLRHVKKYIKGEGGYVLMSDGQCCEVSRRKKTSLLERLSIVQL